MMSPDDLNRRFVQEMLKKEEYLPLLALDWERRKPAGVGLAGDGPPARLYKSALSAEKIVARRHFLDRSASSSISTY